MYLQSLCLIPFVECSLDKYYYLLRCLVEEPLRLLQRAEWRAAARAAYAHCLLSQPLSDSLATPHGITMHLSEVFLEELHGVVGNDGVRCLRCVCCVRCGNYCASQGVCCECVRASTAQSFRAPLTTTPLVHSLHRRLCMIYCRPL